MRKRRKIAKSPAESTSSNAAGDCETRPWSDMCMDLLYQIASRLPHKDYIRLTAVCRNWRRTPCPPRPTARSMLLLLHRVRDGTCKLIDPAGGAPKNLNFPETACTTILASRAGWLLLKKLEFPLDEAKHDLFFFCPATGEKIKLPVIRYFLSKSNYVAAFSSSPLSSDCVTIIIDTSRILVGVFVWHFGDDKWRIQRYQNSHQLFPLHLFSCGHLFYCQAVDNTISVFDTKSINWCVLGKIEGLQLSSPGEPMYTCLFSPKGLMRGVWLSEFQAQLYLVCTCGRHKPFRIDVKAGRLVLGPEVDGLENCTVFVGLKTVEMVTPLDGRVANKIYFPIIFGGRSEKCMYYHPATRKFYPKLQFCLQSKFSQMLKDKLVERVWIEGDQLLHHLKNSLDQ